MQDSFNKANTADIQTELKAILKQLAHASCCYNEVPSCKQAAKVMDDLSKLVEEATKPSPNRKWYSVSIEDLIKEAENV